MPEVDVKMVTAIHDAMALKMPARMCAGVVGVLGSLRNDQCMLLNTLYHQTFRTNLYDDLKKRTGSDFETVCLALVCEPAEYDARMLMKAFKGLGTNEDLAIEILCTRSDAEIKEIASRYESMFRQTLAARVHSEFGGKVRLCLETILRGRSDEPMEDIPSLVKQLYDAGEKKLGTDEKTFIRILAGHSHAVVQQIADQYLKSHGKTLVAVIKSEFSFDQKRCMLALATPTVQYFSERLLNAFTGINVNEDDVIRLIRSRKERDLIEISAYMKANLKRNQDIMTWVNKKTGKKLQRMLVSVCANFCPAT